MLSDEAVRLLKKRFPLLINLQKYSKEDAISDCVAGITVGLMLIPQSIAYASLAGLDPQYGLYSALSGGVAYAIFGTVPQTNIGPSAVLSLLTFQIAGEDHPKAVALLAFLCGILELLFGLFRLGFIIDFVSMPVISGYTSAASIIIATSQVKGLLGMKFDAGNFASIMYNIATNINTIQVFDSILGISCLIILIGSKVLREKYFKENKIIFYLSTAKNAIIVLFSTVLAYVLHRSGKTPFALTGDITGGLPALEVPKFSLEVDDEDLDFLDILEEFGLGIVSITFISITSNIVVAKVFSRGKRLDASQEIVSLGVTNIFGSLIGSMPVCASFSRGAVNNASGVRTTLGGLYTVLLVLLALVVLTPSFYFIPRATMSAVVISAVIFMIETKLAFVLWKTNRKDLIAGLGTFVSSLCFGIEYGLLIGISIDLLFILHHSSRPSISTEFIEVNQQLYWVITPTTGLFFPSSSHIQKRINAEVLRLEKKAETTILVFNLAHVSLMDYTAGQVLKCILCDLRPQFKDCITLHGRTKVIKQLEELIPNLVNFQSLESASSGIMIERV